jgi:hypothetical protein
MKKFTVFFDQVNRTNFQVLAKNEEEAELKAEKLYKKNFTIPGPSTQEGWLSENDGEDK